MFDSHCHLNFKAFRDDAHAVANAMKKNHVSALVVGCDSATSQYAIDLAQEFPNLYASVGLHPIHVLDEPWNSAAMKELAVEERVVAIGEVGLDFYRLPENQEEKRRHLESQYVAFDAAIELAVDLSLPLVLHCRNAYDAVLTVLKPYFSDRGNELNGTIHCFMGTWQQAEQFLAMGFMIGFTGVITYSDIDPSLLEVVEKVPLDRVLIETDAPYLTPEPYRTEGKKNSGKTPRNLPQYSLEVAKKIGEVRNKKMMEIVQVTEANAFRLFDIEDRRNYESR